MAVAPDLMQSATTDAERQDDLQKAALDSLKKTIALVWCTVHYPPGNKAIADAAEAWKNAINTVLSIHDTFLLALLKTRLYFEDTPLDTHDDMSAHFVKEMSDRRIRKIIFWRGVDEGDLERFAPIMSGGAKELLEQGGPCAVLRRQRVQNVEVVENEYTTPEEQDTTGKAYWEVKLLKMGLDKQEILDFLLGTRRLPRLLTDEIRLLVEAMKDPKFLSQVLVHIAKMGSKTGAFEAAELFRLCKRVQYVLLANSLFDPKETPRILTRATQAFEPKLRLQLLAGKARLEADGSDSVDDRMFAFSPDEYAGYVVSSFERNGDWHPSVEPLRFSAERTDELGQAFRARLMTSAAWAGTQAETDAEVGEFCTRLHAPLALDGPASDKPALVEADPKAALEALGSAKQTYAQDLEEGYAHALLARLAASKGKAQEMLDRLTGLLASRINADRAPAALELLALMLDPEFGEKRLGRFKDRLQETLDEGCRAALVSHVVSGLVAGQEDMVGPASQVADVFGEELQRGLLRIFFEEAKGEPSSVLLDFLGGFEAELVPILRDYVKGDDPVTRVRAIELLAAFDSKAAQDLVVAGLDDPDIHVRLITLLTLGRGTAAQGIGGLMKVAGEETASVSLMERCAAITSLGMLRQKHCISLLDKIISKRGWFSRKHGSELKACAALALREIGTAEAMDALRRRVGTLHWTRVDLVRAWFGARVAQLVRLGKAIVAAIVAKVIALCRAMVAAARWVVMLPVRLAMAGLRGLARLFRSRAKAGTEE